MATLQEACEYLDRALAEYSAARSTPAIETAILAMHASLELAFRTYLQESDRLPDDVWEALERPGGVSFPQLVDLMGDYTSVLGPDPRTRALLVSLNTTRAEIAHPVHKPPEEQIVNDAWRFAELITTLWPGLFPGIQVPYVTRVTMEMVHGGITRASPQVTPSPVHPPVSAEARRKPSRARQRPAIFLPLWRGEAKPTRWFLRLLGGLVTGVLATLAWRAAVSLAHWPPPMKTVSVVLVIAALGLAVWSTWLLWRVFRLLGVRRVLILLTVLYLSAVSVRVLTVKDERSLLHRILPQIQWVAGEAWGALANFTRSLVHAPATFKFAYTGRNPLISGIFSISWGSRR